MSEAIICFCLYYQLAVSFSMQVKHLLAQRIREPKLNRRMLYFLFTVIYYEFKDLLYTDGQHQSISTVISASLFYLLSYLIKVIDTFLIIKRVLWGLLWRP